MAEIYAPEISDRPIVFILRVVSMGYAPPPIAAPILFGAPIIANVLELLSFATNHNALPVVLVVDP